MLLNRGSVGNSNRELSFPPNSNPNDYDFFFFSKFQNFNIYHTPVIEDTERVWPEVDVKEIVPTTTKSGASISVTGERQTTTKRGAINIDIWYLTVASYGRV